MIRLLFAALSLTLLSEAGPAAVVGTSHMGSNYIGPNSFTIDQVFTASDPGGERDFTGFVFASLGGGPF